MTEPTDRVLAADIEAAVREVPGVASVFRAGGRISQAVDAGAQLLGIQQEDGSLIRWEHSPSEGSRVEVAIGVQNAPGAADTSDRVHAAIAELCADRGYPSVKLHLTVVHIDEGPPAPERSDRSA